jgi:protein-disulfide isomerase
MSKRFLVILAAIFIGFMGFLFVSKSKSGSPGSGEQATSTSSYAVGEAKKGVTLVEYGDFECSACAQYYPLIKQVKEKYGDDIAFQFRHFPLTQIHQHAMAAHRAAEAAGRQDKFWEMHDLLFEQQKTWAQSSDPKIIFEDYAAQLGLNVEQFKEDYKSADVAGVINADVAEGNKLGVKSTPAFFLNGKKIENPSSLDEFSKVIDQAIADSKQESQQDN